MLATFTPTNNTTTTVIQPGLHARYRFAGVSLGSGFLNRLAVDYVEENDQEGELKQKHHHERSPAALVYRKSSICYPLFLDGRAERTDFTNPLDD